MADIPSFDAQLHELFTDTSYIPFLLTQEVNIDLTANMSNNQLDHMLNEQEAQSHINGLMHGNARLYEQMSQLHIDGSKFNSLVS